MVGGFLILFPPPIFVNTKQGPNVKQKTDNFLFTLPPFGGDKLKKFKRVRNGTRREINEVKQVCGGKSSSKFLGQLP